MYFSRKTARFLSTAVENLPEMFNGVSDKSKNPSNEFFCLIVSGISSITSISSMDGGGIGGFAEMGGGDSLAGGDRDEVLNIGTINLGDDVAVLNLDGDDLDSGVIHAVLSGDGATGVLHGGLDGVTDGGGNNGGSISMVCGGSVSISSSSMGISSSKTISIESIGISFSSSFGISFTLVHSMTGISSISGVMSFNWGIAQNIGGLLAQGNILDLLGIDRDGVADVLSAGNTVLGDQDFVLGHAVGRRAGMVSHGGNGVSKTMGVSVLGIGLGISVGSGSGTGQEERQGKNLMEKKHILKWKSS